MASEKFVQFVFKIWERSKEGSINWQETTDADSFQASFPEHSIRIVKYQENYGDICYCIQIYNNKGKLIDEIESYQIKEYVEDHHAAFNEIFDLAR